MRSDYMRFDDLFYCDERKIDSLYVQLTDNITEKTIQKGRGGKASLNSKVSDIIAKVLNFDLNFEAYTNREETIKKIATCNDKFIDILEAISEKEYKDVFYLIEKYMANKNHIYAIGEIRIFDRYVYYEGRGYERKLPKSVKFPLPIKEEYIMISHNLYTAYPSCEDCVESCGKDYLDTKCKRVIMIMDRKNIVSEFMLAHNFCTKYRFLGQVIKHKDNYFLIPFVVWGACVLL